MKNQIAIILTTFLRNSLFYETVQSILDNWNGGYELFISNQSYKIDIEKVDGFSNFCLNIDNFLHYKINYYNLPYDCGLSYARNFLVKQAHMMGFKYILLSADSIQFTQKYDFDPIIDFLEEDKDRGIVGFSLFGRPSWERNIDLIPGKYFDLTLPKTKPIEFKGTKFQQCEICKNFFLAKTQCLLDNRWDENLKLCEHESYFYELKKNTNWKVFYTDYIEAKYKNVKPLEYDKMRRRMYSEFRKKLQEKYSISGWVKYER